MSLEVAPRLPDAPGVRALLEVLGEANVSVSVGRVCGSRVSAVYLGDALEVLSVTLEPSELDDPALARERAQMFLTEIASLNRAR
jgi:hypothetical protein